MIVGTFAGIPRFGSGRKPPPRKVNSRGTGIDVELPTNWFAPRKNSMPARVTMNAGTPTYATHQPCQAPTRAPMINPITSAESTVSTCGNHSGAPVMSSSIFAHFMNCATTMPTNAATDPTDRSMWPAMITSTMPTARMSTYELPLTMLIRFCGVSVFPPVCHWKKMMISTRAPRMPNWRPELVDPPNILPRSLKRNPVLVSVVSVMLWPPSCSCWSGRWSCCA